MSYDKEEGEIDSDEGELRKRIEELENENNEYEQIARISESYASAYRYCKRNGSLTLPSRYNANKFSNLNWRDIKRAGQVPTDASSISSVEFLPPKKRKRKKSKGSRSKSYAKHSRLHSRRQGQKHCKTTHHDRKKRHIEQNFMNDLEVETISLGSSGSFGHGQNEYQYASLSTDEEEYDNGALPLSREELRLALARSKSREAVVGTLKERLEREKRIENCRTIQRSEVGQLRLDNVDSDNSMSLEEQELRLIALRSAIMKKDLRRKKRNAEVAYSPTDFEELLLDSASPVETDLDDLPGEMEISPATSPRLLLSPVPCDEQSTGSIRSNANNVDTKPVDMDIANSDSGDDTQSHMNQSNSRFGQWQPPSAELNLLSAGVYLGDVDTAASYRPENAVPFSMCADKVAFESSVQRRHPLPPPLSERPYLPHLHSDVYMCNQSKETQILGTDTACDYANDSLSSLVGSITGLRAKPKSTTLERSSLENSIECGNENDPDSDEEKALRAFLLSKIPKSVKNTTDTEQTKKSHPHADIDVRDDCDSNELRSLFVRNFDQIVSKEPSESILKEAVRRLKVKTCTERPPTNLIRLNGNNLTEILLSTETTSNSKETALARKSAKEWESITNIQREKIFASNYENCENVNIKHLMEVEQKRLNVSSFGDRSNINIENDVKAAGDGVYGSSETNSVTEPKFRAESGVLKPLPNELARNTIPSCTVTSDLKVNIKSSDGEKEKSSPSNHHTDTASLLHASKLASPKSQSTLAPMLKEKRENSFYSTGNPKKIIRPILRPIKIVQPHKVINTSSAFKSKIFESFMATAKKSHPAPANIASSGARIITARKLSDTKMDKLIITLGATDTESDEEVELYKKAVEKSIFSACARSESPDSLVGVINDDCFIRKNDASCVLSKSICPTASKVAASDVSAEMLKFSETFENKLDNFLRDVRSKVQKNSVMGCESKLQNVKTDETPMAVRHLPVASQEEYKRLVHRMQILEKQKHLRKSQSTHDSHANNNNKCESALNIPTNLEPLQDINKVQSKSSQKTVRALLPKSPVSSEKSTRKSLIKKVLAKNAIKRKVTTASKNNFCEEIPETLKLTNQLKAYESSFMGISANIVGNLDQSLLLVTEAKNAKISKMLCNRRLKALRLEMEETQRRLKEEQDKMSKLYPQICYSNELITTLKQTRSKIFETAMKMGKSIKGEEYRLDNELKSEITFKSKSLAAEIKFVNSITYCDLDKFEKDLDVVSNERTESKSETPDMETPQLVLKVINTHEMPEEKRNSQDSSTKKQPESNTDKMSPTCKILTGIHVSEKRAAQEVVRVQSGQNMEKDLKNENNENQTEQGEQLTTSIDENKCLTKYVSPLTHLRSTGSWWDPSGIICPYELMGQCEDKDCCYVHLSNRGTLPTDG